MRRSATFKVNNFVKVNPSIKSTQNEKSSVRPQKWGSSVPCCPRKISITLSQSKHEQNVNQSRSLTNASGGKTDKETFKNSALSEAPSR